MGILRLSSFEGLWEECIGQLAAARSFLILTTEKFNIDSKQGSGSLDGSDLIFNIEKIHIDHKCYTQIISTVFRSPSQSGGGKIFFMLGPV